MGRAKAIGLLFLVIGVVILFLKAPGLWWIPVVVGSVLVIGYFVVRPSSSSTLVQTNKVDGELNMLIPNAWNEHEIGLGLERYKSNPTMLGKYVEGIRSRFLIGQDKHTIETRAKFLDSFNKYAEIARESYRWHRYLKGGRAALEEDHADLEAQIKVQMSRNALDGLQTDPELIELQRRAARLEAQLVIARSQKALDDLKTPPPAAPTVSDTRQQQRRDLEQREEEVIKKIHQTDSDTTLGVELKARKLNGLNEKLAEIQEELTNLL